MNLPAAIATVVRGIHLTEAQAASVARELMSGIATPAQIAGLLVALRMKGETVDELTGFVRAMRDGAQPCPLCEDALDTCGTGGDGAGTFNISTAVAFVAAGAGCRVAKHGNRSNLSRCGSADVLEALGVRTQAAPERSAQAVRELGVAFFFAPQYHPGARHAVGPRREVGVRTIFNAIGPLTHPAGARRQLMGVYDAGLTEPIAHTLARLGSLHCLVVHGADGLDEMSLCGPTRVSELRDGVVRTYEISPAEFGLPPAAVAALAGGDPGRNAEILLSILRGERGPRRDVVLLNAGAAIYVGGRAADIREGVCMAERSLDQGAALAKLQALISFSNEP